MKRLLKISWHENPYFSKTISKRTQNTIIYHGVHKYCYEKVVYITDVQSVTFIDVNIDVVVLGRHYY